MSVAATDVSQVRLAKNQALFRSVNERVKVMSETFETGPAGFVCECPSDDCAGHIDLTDEEYEAVRSNSRHFAVLPGHVVPSIETVVAEHERFVVVEKVDTAGRVAEATDTRAALR